MATLSKGCAACMDALGALSSINTCFLPEGAVEGCSADDMRIVSAVDQCGNDQSCQTVAVQKYSLGCMACIFHWNLADAFEGKGKCQGPGFKSVVATVRYSQPRICITGTGVC